MKKALALGAALLALALCLTAALASGGSAADPLISLSYLQGLFTQSAETAVDTRINESDDSIRDQVQQELEDMRSAAEAAAGENIAPVLTEISLKNGDTLTGATGLLVTPLAGEITLSVSGGAVVDATAGHEIPSGSVLSPNHRYIVAEESLAHFTVTSPSAVLSYQGSYAFSLSNTTPDWHAISCALRELGLFRGTDSAVGHGFDLHKIPTRAQGLVMFIRILGEEGQALACDYTHPFTDVPEWMDRYVAWAYHRGYTNGVSSTHFGTEQSISAVEYQEFLLRALGYSVAGIHDFSTSLERSLELNALTPGEYQMLTEETFLRAHVAYISFYTLNMGISGSQQTLAQRLIGAGAFTPYQLSAAASLIPSRRIA